MTQSADKKPEKYVGPDGKAKIRMVPVDKELVKSEGGMKRIATTQSNKTDRMASGGNQGLGTFKKKPVPEGTTSMRNLKLIDKIKKSGAVKSGSMAKESKDEFEPHMMYDPKTGKEYKATKPEDHERMAKMGYSHDKPKVNEVSSKTLSNYMRKSAANAGKPRQDARTQDKRIGGQKMADDKLRKMQGKGSAAKVAATKEANTYVGQRDQMKITDRKPHPDGGHIVTLQTKAGKTIKRHLKNGKVKDIKEAQLAATNEVLDTPKAMQSYKDKAKYSKDKATNSAVANILRKGDHTDDLKTRAKRVKGLGMADRNATKKTAKALRKEESVNELSKDTMQSYWDKTKGDDAFSGSRKANNRLKGAINVTTKLDKLKKMIKR